MRTSKNEQLRKRLSVFLSPYASFNLSAKKKYEIGNAGSAKSFGSHSSAQWAALCLDEYTYINDFIRDGRGGWRVVVLAKNEKTVEDAKRLGLYILSDDDCGELASSYERSTDCGFSEYVKIMPDSVKAFLDFYGF
ncbi:hypothetical protein [Photobacterium kishitanii]|uniref:Uncharacterized protein n=1 Tax=Photobacterium kishitanii TaxID=318456 RepID=A0A2T3KMB3_9GAMM|nr:hypothetical protein [Photobacterium kishitanii]PSV00940.1 hypothetical protein C9J27_02640 [Photobacterium kishitanii]